MLAKMNVHIFDPEYILSAWNICIIISLPSSPHTPDPDPLDWPPTYKRDKYSGMQGDLEDKEWKVHLVSNEVSSRGQILKRTKSSIITTPKWLKAEQFMFKQLGKIALLSMPPIKPRNGCHHLSSDLDWSILELACSWKWFTMQRLCLAYTDETAPLICLRGFCLNSVESSWTWEIHNDTTATDPGNVIMVNNCEDRIWLYTQPVQWVLLDPRLNVTAKTRAISNSFALGKHKWTRWQVSMLQREIQMKLTGCKEEAITCDDGQWWRKLLYNLSSSIDY